jgi:hypothetical protein
MSDEAHFHLSGHANKQNFSYWAAANTRQLHERHLHSAAVAVWRAISSNGVIGSYFFENDDGHKVTVTSARYVHMRENFLIPELHRLPVHEKTHATSHTAGVTMNPLKTFSRTVSSVGMGTFSGPHDRQT